VRALIESKVTRCAGLRYCVRICRSMVGWLEWPVNSVVGNFKEKGAARVFIDKAYRALGNCIRQIFIRLNWCRVFKEVRHPVAAPMCVVVNGTAEETEKLIEALRVRTQLGFEP